jgi:hypothetical protein
MVNVLPVPRFLPSPGSSASVGDIASALTRKQQNQIDRFGTPGAITVYCGKREMVLHHPDALQV